MSQRIESRRQFRRRVRAVKLYNKTAALVGLPLLPLPVAPLPLV